MYIYTNKIHIIYTLLSRSFAFFFLVELKACKMSTDIPGAMEEEEFWLRIVAQNRRRRSLSLSLSLPFRLAY